MELTEKATTETSAQQDANAQDSSITEKLMTDAAFISKVQGALEGVAGQVLDGLLEAASRLRQILRVLRSLLTTPW